MFRAGDIEGTLTLDRTPFNDGLRMARADADAFQRNKITATVNLDVADAERRLVEMDRSRTINANYELDTTAAEAKITALEARARNIGGSIGGGGVGGTGGGGSSSGPGLFGVGRGVLLPAALGLGASFLPTIGATAAQGALGAGALGLGGLGALGVGAGSIAATGAPAIMQLKSLYTAQLAYNKAVADYGKDSTEAKQALTNLNAVQKTVSQSAAQAMNRLDALKSRWGQLSMPAQNDFFGLLNDAIQEANRLMPMFANIAQRDMGAARGAVDHFLGSLNSRDSQTFFHTMSTLFAQGVGPFERGLENIAHVLGRIAVASAPDVLKMLQGFQSMTHHWEQSTQNAGQLQHTIHGYVGDFRAWLDLAGSLGHVLSALFITNHQGARSGKQELEAMSRQLDVWARWISHHHHDITQFFSGLNQDFGLLLNSAGQIASVVLPAFQPVAKIIHSVVESLNSLKVGNVSALTVLLGAMAGRSVLGRLGLPGGGSSGGGSGGPGGVNFFGNLGTTMLLAGAIGDFELQKSQAAGAQRRTPPPATLSTDPNAGGNIITQGFGALFAGGGPPDHVIHTMAGLAAEVDHGTQALRGMGRVLNAINVKPMVNAISGLKDQYGTLINAAGQMSGAQRKAFIDMARQARASGEITQAQLKNVVNAFTNSGQQIRDQQRKAAQVTGQTTQSIANSVGDAAVHVSHTYGGMVHVVGAGLDWLTSNTSKAAQAMGIKKQINFHTTPIGGATGSAHVQGTSGNEHLAGGALGGFLPGHSSTDNIHLMARGGEAILRPEDHVPIVSRALMNTYGFGLGDLFNRTGARVAGYQQGGIVDRTGVPHFAKGGLAYPFPKSWPPSKLGRTDEGVDLQVPGVPIGAIGDAVVTSNVNAFAPSYGSSNQGMVYKLLGGAPKGYAPSSPYVYIYEGLDKVGFGHHLSAGQLLGHIHSGFPGIEMGWAAGPSGPALAHLTYTEGQQTAAGLSFRRLLSDLASGKAVSGAAIERIKRLILHPHNNMEGGVGQGALDHIWHAANHFLATHQPSAQSLGGASSFANIKASGVEQLAHKMVLAEWGAGQWPPFVNVEMQEAGWNVHAQNPKSTAYGLAQNLNPSTYPAAGRPGSTAPIMDQAKAQLTWMINYIRGRYGNPAGAWAHEQAFNWYANGGDFVTKGPTVFGAGEAGPEHVSIRPLSQRSRINFSPDIHVHVHAHPGSGAAQWRDDVRVEVEGVLEEYGDLAHAEAAMR